MDDHVERLLNRISLCLTAIATLSLLHLFSHSSSSCSPSLLHPQNPSQTQTLTLTPFPTSSCNSSSRLTISPEKRFQKLQSTLSFRRRVQSFSSLFSLLRSLSFLSNSSHVLCVSSGAGHDVAALQDSGIVDVTGVDIVDFPPLVKRADPHNLPFFDGVFDVGFSAGFGDSLFPRRFVGEMERVVRRGGVTAMAVAEEDVGDVGKLFRASGVVEVRNFMLDGSPVSLVVMRKNGDGRKGY